MINLQHSMFKECESILSILLILGTNKTRSKLAAQSQESTECGSSSPGNVRHHAVRWGTELGLMSPGTTEEGEPENHQAWGCAHTSRFSKHHQSPSGLMIAQSTNIEQWVTNLGYNGCVPPPPPGALQPSQLCTAHILTPGPPNRAESCADTWVISHFLSPSDPQGRSQKLVLWLPLQIVGSHD